MRHFSFGQKRSAEHFSCWPNGVWARISLFSLFVTDCFSLGFAFVLFFSSLHLRLLGFRFFFFRTRLNTAKAKFELNRPSAAVDVAAAKVKPLARRMFSRRHALSRCRALTLAQNWLAALHMCVGGARPARCEREALRIIFKYGVLFAQSQSHAPCNGSQRHLALSRSLAAPRQHSLREQQLSAESAAPWGRQHINFVLASLRPYVTRSPSLSALSWGAQRQLLCLFCLMGLSTAAERSSAAAEVSLSSH